MSCDLLKRVGTSVLGMSVPQLKIAQTVFDVGSGFLKAEGAVSSINRQLNIIGDAIESTEAQKKAVRSAKEGNVIAYIHPGSKLGVMLEINCETDFVANTEDFKNLGRDIAMHIAATNPISVSIEEVSDEVLSKEKEIYLEQAQKQNKPDNIIEKMVEGRVQKFYKETVLLNQEFVKDPNKTITDLITEAVGKLGENIVISRFSRFQLGDKQ